jgi:hypothetical protein
VCEREAAIAEAYLYMSRVVEHDTHSTLTVGLGLRESIDHSEAVRISRSLVDEVDPHEWGYESFDIQFLSADCSTR